MLWDSLKFKNSDLVEHLWASAYDNAFLIAATSTDARVNETDVVETSPNQYSEVLNWYYSENRGKVHLFERSRVDSIYF